jgi:FkbM family methyltransferase
VDALGVPVTNRVPVLFRIAKSLERRNIRGSTRLLKVLRQIGYLDQAVEFSLSNSVRIRVPIARNEYDEIDVCNYETELIASLSEQIRQLRDPITLIDGGADIGLFSLRIIALCPSISHVIAFEPNIDGYSWLRLNLSMLPDGIEARASSAAVADFCGRGRLAFPDPCFTPGIPTNHTQFFLEKCSDGPVDVTTIDSLNVQPMGSTVIKIDVEGGELAVLRGAAGTIRDVRDCLVILEAHPGVVRRTGIDPVECLRLLASLREFRFIVSETGDLLNTDRAVFDQISPSRVYNLIARSQ